MIRRSSQASALSGYHSQTVQSSISGLSRLNKLSYWPGSSLQCSRDAWVIIHSVSISTFNGPQNYLQLGPYSKQEGELTILPNRYLVAVFSIAQSCGSSILQASRNNFPIAQPDRNKRRPNLQPSTLKWFKVSGLGILQDIFKAEM